jgi:SAF domain
VTAAFLLMVVAAAACGPIEANTPTTSTSNVCPETMISVVVAVHDLSAGTQVAPTDVVTQVRSSRQVGVGSLTNANDAVGRYAALNIVANEVLTNSVLLPGPSPAASIPSSDLVTPCPVGPRTTLDVPEFGITMTLPAGVQDASYTIVRYPPEASHGGLVVGSIFLSARSLWLDAQCGGPIKHVDASTIYVYSAAPPQDPTVGPIRHVGLYWFGFQPPTTYCSDAEMTDEQLFRQAFDTLRLS